jgi:hypothetical protein
MVQVVNHNNDTLRRCAAIGTGSEAYDQYRDEQQTEIRVFQQARTSYRQGIEQTGHSGRARSYHAQGFIRLCDETFTTSGASSTR